MLNRIGDDFEIAVLACFERNFDFPFHQLFPLAAVADDLLDRYQRDIEFARKLSQFGHVGHFAGRTRVDLGVVLRPVDVLEPLDHRRGRRRRLRIGIGQAPFVERLGHLRHRTIVARPDVERLAGRLRQRERFGEGAAEIAQEPPMTPIAARQGEAVSRSYADAFMALRAGVAATLPEDTAPGEREALTDWVAGLPDGLDTVVGERGYRMSGGGKQRIALARVLVKDPAIVILDEATSSVDTRTELLLQHAMGALRADRTSFVIAHRLSTIRRADLILLMEHGAVVERGTHEALMQQQGLYHEMVKRQEAGQEQF